MRRQASLVISAAPAIRQVARPRPPSTVIYLHLGPVVRFTPNAVSINTAAALQDIYGSRKANIVKSDWYRTIQYAERGTASTFTAINPKQHAQKRSEERRVGKECRS